MIISKLASTTDDLDHANPHSTSGPPVSRYAQCIALYPLVHRAAVRCMSVSGADESPSEMNGRNWRGPDSHSLRLTCSWREDQDREREPRGRISGLRRCSEAWKPHDRGRGNRRRSVGRRAIFDCTTAGWRLHPLVHHLSEGCTHGRLRNVPTSHGPRSRHFGCHDRLGQGRSADV